MSYPDVVNHWDLPVTNHKPKRESVCVLSPAATNDRELIAVLHRREVTVFDFYRYRADRADALRRYA